MVSEPGSVTPCGLKDATPENGPNKDVKDLSGVIVMPQFGWLCDMCGCVMSPTSGIYWVDLGFINNYKEPQLWLVLLRYSADVASVFPWVITPIG